LRIADHPLPFHPPLAGNVGRNPPEKTNTSRDEIESVTTFVSVAT
jgi:hypothetical protein